MTLSAEETGSHISRQFSQDLEKVRTHMLRMGGQVEKTLTDALRSVAEHDSQLAQQVIDRDEVIDRLEREIDIECSLIIARRQPAAGDLRLVLAIIKAIRDLERIGDEAARIARSALQLAEEGEDPVNLGEFHNIGDRVLSMVKHALDAFARMDAEAAAAIRGEDVEVDNEYHNAIRSTVTHMMENPESVSAALIVLWAFRALERIGDHAKNISEHVAYMVIGANLGRGRPLPKK
ncbi:MAG: phosphate signaling complex protein PhoU [Gammaproteobacteria bacterium]|nr:phosphate signaling complex protein PhoU [Gammaproteobacteria bacterium]MDE0510159.1 phosphate signaling complex protein PhoU [Gammaproteobacteria bacterium]MYA68285.1 phosphate signaling complex protein PhoU [Gammaproteobacteria bacterium]MYH47059.1 phosphate signaling complex protein PhoU [Gammaproteobacteria bacterium]MYL14984.1 phosphate signaling complex protein PhoU [Gammaproteobacteria bacterium]